MTRLAALLTLLTFLLPVQGICEEERPFITRIGAGTGYAFGELRDGQGDYRVVPLHVRAATRLNEPLGWGRKYGDLEFGLEPDFNIIVNPKCGLEFALMLLFEYAYHFTDAWTFFIEAGSGPGYLSIDTIEQGEAGFNFLNQGGGGFRYTCEDNRSVQVGYRYRHMSHGGTRNARNSGIDTHCIIVGVNQHF